MKRKLAIFTMLSIMIFSLALEAQERQGRRQRDPNEVRLINKVKAMEFLELTNEQKEVIGKEIDELILLWEPFQEERRETMDEQRAAGGDREQMRTAMREFQEKHKELEDKFKAHIANIEKVLTPGQKEKFAKVVKPTIQMRRRRG